MMKYEIIVELKPEVLDVQGRAICEAINRAHKGSVRELNLSKRYVIDLGEHSTEQKAHEIARTYLSNPISEQYHLRVL